MLKKLSKYQENLIKFKKDVKTFQTRIHHDTRKFNWDSLIDTIITSIENIRSLKSKYDELLLKKRLKNSQSIDAESLQKENIDFGVLRFRPWNHDHLKNFIDTIVKALEFVEEEIIHRITTASEENSNEQIQKSLVEKEYTNLSTVQRYIKGGDGFCEYFNSLFDVNKDPANKGEKKKNQMKQQNSIMAAWICVSKDTRAYNGRSGPHSELRAAREEIDKISNNLFSRTVIISSVHLTFM